MSGNGIIDAVTSRFRKWWGKSMVRASNVLKRALKEVKRRAKVVGRFSTEASALMSLEQDPFRLGFLEKAWGV